MFLDRLDEIYFCLIKMYLGGSGAGFPFYGTYFPWKAPVGFLRKDLTGRERDAIILVCYHSH